MEGGRLTVRPRASGAGGWLAEDKCNKAGEMHCSENDPCPCSNEYLVHQPARCNSWKLVPHEQCQSLRCLLAKYCSVKYKPKAHPAGLQCQCKLATSGVAKSITVAGTPAADPLGAMVHERHIAAELEIE